MSSGEPLLAVETAYYKKHFEEFKRDYPGRFLLIKGGNIVGDFATHDEAIKEGVLRFGRGPFLAQRADEKPPVFFAPALTLGILQCRS